jgi:hypothetical protein
MTRIDDARFNSNTIARPSPTKPITTGMNQPTRVQQGLALKRPMGDNNVVQTNLVTSNYQRTTMTRHDIPQARGHQAMAPPSPM